MNKNEEEEHYNKLTKEKLLEIVEDLIVKVELIGLYDKYTVTKKDGTTDPAADYFVLRIDKDHHARIAALAYADSIRSENRSIALDIYEKVMTYDETLVKR